MTWAPSESSTQAFGPSTVTTRTLAALVIVASALGSRSSRCRRMTSCGRTNATAGPSGSLFSTGNDLSPARAPVRDHAVEGVGATEELVDERGLRCFVNFCRRADLFDTATGHDRDTVSKRQRFFLIVRHEHGREGRRIVQLAQPSPEI